MTTLKVNAIEPEGATTNLTVGMTGQNVVVGGSGGIKANTFKDAGGNTLWTSNGSGVLSSVSGFGGAQVLISSQTASDSASIDFTTGIDNTYKEYVFEFIAIQPETDNIDIAFQANVSGQSGFNETMTTTIFYSYNNEAGSDSIFAYNANADQAQGTAYQTIARSRSSGASHSSSGELHLFNPASTTYVKNFYSTIVGNRSNDYTWTNFTAGYFNTTGAINEVSFKMLTDNIASGTIKMYGVK